MLPLSKAVLNSFANCNIRDYGPVFVHLVTFIVR